MRKVKTIKKVFLEDLPRGGANRGDRINWLKSVGCLVKFIYDNIIGYVEIASYERDYINIKYLNEEPFRINIDNFKDCRLGKLLKRKTDEFKIQLGEILNDKKRNMIITGREHVIEKNRNWKVYNYKCNTCGYDGTMEESNLLQGKNCSCCSNKTIIEGVNDITTTAPWMVKYFQNPEDAKHCMKSSNKKIYPICPDCGRIKDKEMKINDIYRVHGIYCPCGDKQSYPSKFVFSLLQQLNMKFKTEYSPKWCKYIIKNKDRTGRYDFYFEKDNKKYIIETDGAQHKKDKSRNSHWLSLKEQTEIDENKDKLANEHNINVIRIDCEFSNMDYIKNNIKLSKFNGLLDLTNIDWLKCHEYACSNRVKAVCDYKMQHDNLSCNDIGKIMKISSSAVRNYLKKGTILNWCKYDAKEERKKSDIRMMDFRNKKVEVYKDNIFLGVYPSIKELSRISEDMFKIKFETSGITGVCYGRHKLHRKYNFKFVNTTTPILYLPLPKSPTETVTTLVS